MYLVPVFGSNYFCSCVTRCLFVMRWSFNSFDSHLSWKSLLSAVHTPTRSSVYCFDIILMEISFFSFSISWKTLWGTTCVWTRDPTMTTSPSCTSVTGWRLRFGPCVCNIRPDLTSSAYIWAPLRRSANANAAHWVFISSCHWSLCHIISEQIVFWHRSTMPGMVERGLASIISNHLLSHLVSTNCYSPVVWILSVKLNYMKPTSPSRSTVYTTPCWYYHSSL